MAYKEQLAVIREQIDKLDSEYLQLFSRRMELAREVAKIKGENNLAILDEGREQQIVDRTADLVVPSLRGEAALLMRTTLALSRGQQRNLLFHNEAPLLPPPRLHKNTDLKCAYQGVAGAWSEQAARRFFPDAELLSSEYFEDVFDAVKNGSADYGVVPIENSRTGAIGETYDLLRKHGCYIVGRLWIDIKQCLIGNKDATLDDIREVYSHPEGFKQCRKFLNHRAWEQVACRNTAVAAELVAKTASKRVAAIGSRIASELNGLQILASDITDDSGNRTSFVVISAEPEYTERDNLISVTFSTQHRSGALCETLLPFMAQGINMMRIESRPTTGGKYRFFMELEANILDADTLSTLRQAAAASEYFEIIGCYTQIGE
ncbi:chorismate mutase [Clostridia bacterium]|nr:chorismate mutase [Clostridia bacterium]